MAGNISKPGIFQGLPVNETAFGGQTSKLGHTEKTSVTNLDNRPPHTHYGLASFGLQQGHVRQARDMRENSIIIVTTG